MKIKVTARSYPLRHTFAISRGQRTVANVIEVCIEDSGACGYGECVPYQRYGESMESVAEAISSLEVPITRASLQKSLPPGAARNAVDCALWDLEAKQQGQPVWKLSGLDEPEAVITAYTISLDEPSRMHDDARQNRHRPLLKVKLGNERNRERICAVREGSPDARVIVDANESWTMQELESCLDAFRESGVEMIEQPLPAGMDDDLGKLEDNGIALCADESCHDRNSLEKLTSGYSIINVKLDKTGGLTEALALLQEARSRQLDIMVGCMIGSSLAMAPAVLLAQHARYVDLDGPLHMSSDINNGLTYSNSTVFPANSRLWG